MVSMAHYDGLDCSCGNWSCKHCKEARTGVVVGQIVAKNGGEQLYLVECKAGDRVPIRGRRLNHVTVTRNDGTKFVIHDRNVGGMRPISVPQMFDTIVGSDVKRVDYSDSWRPYGNPRALKRVRTGWRALD
jgi:hypothetical protein